MADGTVRGAFELDAAQPLRDLGQIRDLGAAADTSLANLGRTMDSLGGVTSSRGLDDYRSKLDSVGTTAESVTARVSASWDGQRKAIDDSATRIEARIDTLSAKLDRYSEKRATATIDLSGFEKVNAELAEIEARLDRIGGKTARPSVAASGGGAGGGGASRLASSRDDGRGRLFSTLGGIGGKLPWWAAALPLAPALIGGATSLVGSAGAGALGAGVVGLGGLSTLATGGALSEAIIKPAITNLGTVTAAQQKYTLAVQEFGKASSQAKTALKAYNVELVNNPLAAGAATQYGLLRSEWNTATTPARAAAYKGMSNVLYSARRAVPAVAADATTATTATAGAASNFAGFLTSSSSLTTMSTLTSAFARELPLAENSLQNIATIFMHLSVDALPFFHDANVWVNNWSAKMATSSGDTQRVSSEMGGLVTSAKDWAHLTGAVYDTLRDIFKAGTPEGNSMVVDLTNSFDKWDTWIRNNPQKVSNFFQQAETTTDHIASAVKGLVTDIWKLVSMVQPLLNQAASFISLASSIGGGNALLGGTAIYGGITGARRAFSSGKGAGIGGASTGSIMRSLATGSPGPAMRSAIRAGGGNVISSGGAVPILARAEGQAAAAEAGTRLVPAGSGAMRLASSEEALAAQAEGPGVLSSLAGMLTLRSTRSAVKTGASAVSDLVSGSGDARAVAGTALGSLGSTLGEAAMGAARFVGPLMLINGLFAGMSASGGVLDRTGAALHALTFGIVPSDLVSKAFGTTTTGASLSNPTTKRMIAALQSQLTTDRTPGQFLTTAHKLVAAGQPSGLVSELPGGGQGTGAHPVETGEAAKYAAWVKQATNAAFSGAGTTAATGWESAFSTDLQRGTPPQKVVGTMLANMTDQIKTLGPKGALAFAQSTATWAQQMEKSNPKLRGPLQDLMKGITSDLTSIDHETTKTMSGLQGTVQYYNGQILTGSAAQWAQISYNMTNTLQVAQEKMSGSFSTILGEALGSLKAMGYSPSEAANLIKGIQQGTVSSAQVQQGAGGGLGGAVTSGFLAVASAGIGAGKKERGGMIGGSGLLDTVPTPDGGLAAPGEAWIANRHTMNALSSATLAKYGKTAWQMINSESRPHSAPMQFALGGSLGSVFGGIANAASGSSPSGGGGSRFARLLSAANQVSSRNFPYVWGGGHEQPARFGPFDCSGAVSYVVQQAGYNVPTTTAGDIGSWGFPPGAGTASIYYSPTHTFMKIDSSGPRGIGYWGTSGFARPGGGAGWFDQSPGGGYLSGFKVVHLPGLGSIAGMGSGAGGAGSVNLTAPHLGLSGVPGALGQSGANMYAAGLQQKINQKLSLLGGSGITGGGNALESGSGVQGEVAQFMGAAGFNRIAIAGMLGNASQESSMKPNTPGGGLFQQISNFGSGTGGSLLHQLQTMLPQIEGLKARMNSAGSPGAAATIFEQSFERAGIPALANRIAAANAAYASGYGRGGGVKWGGWHSKGLDAVTNGPTVFGAGEKGRERVTVTPVGRGDGKQIVVDMTGSRFYGVSDHTAKSLAEDVAAKIIDALDRVGQGASDGQLMGATS